MVVPNKKNTGKPYEKLTQKIFDQIINQDSAQNIEVKHDVILQGRTTKHQIDVYWEFDLNGIQYRTIIQAKDWKTKVKKEHIFAFKGVLDDLPYGTSGIFVSKSGFQSGALDVARALGIRLYELRKPTDEDWGNTITSVEIHQHLYIPYFKNLKLTLDKEWLVSHIDKNNLPPSGTAFHGDYDIVDEHGNRISSISEVINAFLRQASEEETHFVKDFENSFIVHQGQLLKLKSLCGEYGFRVSTDVIKINIEDIVGMILKDTLEGSFRKIDKYDNLIGGKPNA